MRLKSIKLAGFKSFVDPTTVTFPSNLCAIVGPNGCGKSNIIDAVRWVLGESSARNLRAEASTDVIFNGSSARKPTALATIELLFDNGDGRIGGEYANYAEIAIRRQISRDGTSQYYLNGVRCRRRDVLDVFLGTGFGARSYSIIEQGTISELVEAKPDELRAYLEEAAGVSKYRERRRETETRIRHTRENLARLADLRGELGTQIARLERQAQAAERYRELKDLEARQAAEALALRWRGLGSEADGLASLIREREVEHERERAGQRRLEAAIEQARTQHAADNDRFNAVQGRFYAVGADLVRLEEAIETRTRRRDELGGEIAALAQRGDDADADLSAARAGQAAAERRHDAVAPQAATADQEVRSRAAAVSTAVAVHADAVAALDRAGSEAAAHQRRLDACDSRIEHAGMLIQRLDARRLLLEDEARLVGDADDDQPLRSLEARAAAMSGELDEVARTLQVLAQRIGEGRSTVAAAEEALEDARRRWQERQREQSALAALQDAALGRRDSVAGAWLGAAGLAQARRLAESLAVAPGWEIAVEAVLGAALSGVLVERLDDHADGLDGFERGRLLLVEPLHAAAAEPPPTALLRRVRGDAVRGLLAGVHAVDTLAEALALRATLPPAECVVTRNGCVLGANWLRLSRGDEQEHGVLLRAQQLSALAIATEQAGRDVEAAREHLAAVRQQQAEREAERGLAQQRLADGNRDLGGIRAELSAGRVRVEATRARRDRIAREHAELVRQVDAERVRLEQHRGEHAALTADAGRLAGERARAGEQRAAAASRLEELRRSHAEARDRQHAIELERQAAHSELQAARTSVQRLETLRDELAQRLATARRQHDEVVAPLDGLAAQRAEALAARATVEQELALARQALETRAHEIRTQESAATEAAARADAVRARLDEARLASEGVRARRGAVAEQLQALGREVELVAAQLSADATVESAEAELTRTQARIARLGAINLAAIDEFRAQSERKQYLDAQNADLEAALAELEGAIGRIDRETRTRFRETFDAVNARLGELFPKVFGGGEAALQMEDGDVLTAGISFMARPPGKRNASIHLLSGGEKALAALSLIFAIFQMNPSPVCMLDEVDAPLDDTNVGRYAALIKEMSADVQFVYVTHNKISMEMADQLMGVTMQEPGVSRLVSVDVERALAMAGG
jgi:chromosome segregation protein